MNYIHNQHPRYPVFAASGGFASYKDYWYLAQHWEEECEIIHRWCAILGSSEDEYIIHNLRQEKGLRLNFIGVLYWRTHQMISIQWSYYSKPCLGI